MSLTEDEISEEQESIPFINALLQSDVPSEQVSMYHNETLVILVTCFVLDHQVCT